MSFGPLLLTDDHDSNLQPEQATAIGLLTIAIWEFKLTSVGFPPTQAFTEQMQTFPEQVLKGIALDLMTKFREVKDWKPVRYSRDHCIGDEPLATMVLKYRSREALQKIGLVPRSPTLTPLEERDINDLTMEELKERLELRKRTE